MRNKILIIGDVNDDGIQFALDESKNDYIVDGEPIHGFGIHKVTMDATGVGWKEELHCVKVFTADALTEFNNLAKLVKAGAFKSN